jgi:hypothetical protein
LASALKVKEWTPSVIRDSFTRNISTAKRLTKGAHYHPKGNVTSSIECIHGNGNCSDEMLVHHLDIYIIFLAVRGGGEAAVHVGLPDVHFSKVFHDGFAIVTCGPSTIFHFNASIRVIFSPFSRRRPVCTEQRPEEENNQLGRKVVKFFFENKFHMDSD